MNAALDPASAAPAGGAGPAAAAPADAAAPFRAPADDSQCPARNCRELPPLNARDPYRQRVVVHGDTSAFSNSRSVSECASAGPDLLYDLDLRAFAAPVMVYAEVRGHFDASLVLEQARVDDPFVIVCNEDHASGAREAFVAATLAPGRYRLVVDGEAATDSGEFDLVVELPSQAGRCSVPPPNDRCADAIPLDVSLPVQTFFGTTECATDQASTPFECGSYTARQGEVVYGLDLSQRSEPVLVHARTDVPPTNFDPFLIITRRVGGECVQELVCNGAANYGYLPELWAKLEPGNYALLVESSDSAGDFGLSVEIAQEPCSVANDTCATAQAIEPKLGVQHFTVWPMCGDDSWESGCGISEDAPDIFYALDLSQYAGLVHVAVAARRSEANYHNLVLLAEEGGSCGSGLWCGNFDLWLEPKRYFIALDGYRDEQGPVELSVSIEQETPPGPFACIDAEVAACAGALGCCAGDSNGCWLAFITCGVRPEVFDCLCVTQPACCTNDRGSFECGRVMSECGAFCPGFDVALSCPG